MDSLAPVAFILATQSSLVIKEKPGVTVISILFKVSLL